MQFHTTLANKDVEILFRFGQDGMYNSTSLYFGHPDAKLLPSYWEKTKLSPKVVMLGQGLNLKRSANLIQAVLGAEHLHEDDGSCFAAHNLFCTSELTKVQLELFQQLFDSTFRKKYTRDRKHGQVPDRLQITRGHMCQNVQSWTEYSSRRWQIKEQLSKDSSTLRSIDSLKTAGVFPDEDQYHLDTNAHEQFLFHGTNDQAATAITKGDFLVNLAGSNAGTLYGRGIYLAESVSKSDEYTMENYAGERCILVCRATLGFVNYTDEVSPNVDNLVKSCTTGPYHCVLGDREKCRGTFREIIVYNNEQVYPEYVIWYKRVYE